jgi:hypothetical protein
MNNFPNTRSNPLSTIQASKQTKKTNAPRIRYTLVGKRSAGEKCDFERGGRKYLLWKFLLADALRCVLQIDRGRQAFGECKERIY